MKKLINISLLAILALAPACSKDNMFEPDGKAGAKGTLSTSSLMIEFRNKEKVIKNLPAKTRAEGVDYNNFVIDIVKDGETAPTYHELFGALPEVVTLPVGDYKIYASYGENQAAAFEAPYYKGEASFTIVENEITDNIGQITCDLANVKVSVAFDENLRYHMANDAKITVKVGDSGELTFTKEDDMNYEGARAGYFAFVEDSHSLVATFDGEIDGDETTESKTYNDVEPGNYYKITFSLHNVGGSEMGSATGDVKVDASVEIENVNFDGDPDSAELEEKYLEDDRFPAEGGEDPIVPDDPIDPSGSVGPTIVAKAPVNLEATNNVSEISECIINVTSKTGFTKFEVNVKDSPEMEDALIQMVGSLPLDLLHPRADQEEMFEGMFGQLYHEGDKSAVFNITEFLPLLSALKEDVLHQFVLTVADAEGENTVILKLYVPKK